MLPIPFPKHTTYAGHSGVDFPYATGTQVKASASGTVTFRGWLNNNAGNSVIVEYAGGLRVLYCHFNNLNATPAVGTRVSEGSVIGTVGSTGRSTGPHLHMEIMTGSSAHTNAGIWRHFDRNRVVGSAPAPSKFSQEVANQQAWLNANQGEKLAVDGIMGPATRAAIARYQRFLGVLDDGIWGPNTQNKHQAHYDRVTTPAPVQGEYAKIQAALNRHGYNLVVDNIWGPLSSNALADFQRKNGLTPDRIVGPLTRAKLGI